MTDIPVANGMDLATVPPKATREEWTRSSPRCTWTRSGRGARVTSAIEATP
jgi:hypothetical protein